MNEIRSEIRASALEGTTEISAEGIARTFCFSPDFIGFQGHFPNYPILPAYVQVLLAVVLTEEFAGSDLQMAEVNHAKYLIPLRPDQYITVSVCPSKRSEEAVFAVQIGVEGKRASAFNLKFQSKRG